MSPPAAAHPFRVGGRYENRQGLFEVLALDRETMRIRHDTGEESTTPIEFQARVLRNMEREQRAATSAKGYKAPKSYGERFTGLQAADFRQDVAGTHWRSREQLGGAVSRLIEVPEPFDSWSVYRRAEVHWASVARRGAADAWLQSKFFARLTEEDLLFGLYLERSNDPSKNQDDWRRFLAWLEQPGHARWLHGAMLAQEAAFINPYHAAEDQAFQGTLRAREDGQFAHEAKSAALIAPEELGAFLEARPADLFLNLIVGRTLGRDAAIAEGPHVAATMAALFNALMPIYAGAKPK